jgi:hypothetical protein
MKYTALKTTSSKIFDLPIVYIYRIQVSKIYKNVRNLNPQSTILLAPLEP